MSAKDWYAKKLGAPPPLQRSQVPLGPVPVFTPNAQGVPVYNAPPVEPPVGANDFGTAIRVYRGSKAAQTGAGTCPNCGRDGFFADLPTVDENAAVSTNRLIARSSARQGHCFYCGYSETGRGTPSDQGAAALGTVEGAHKARGQAQDVYATSQVSTAIGRRPLAIAHIGPGGIS